MNTSTVRLSIKGDEAGMAVTLVIDGESVGRTIVTRDEVEAMRRPLYNTKGVRDFSGIDTAIRIRSQLWDRGHAHKVLALTPLRKTLVRSWDSLRVRTPDDAV